MQGLMMDFQLTIPTILRRTETFYGNQEVVSRQANKTTFKYTYTQMVHRAKKLAVALQNLNIKEGDRVATLCWNHHQHLESYFAIPCIGAVIHPLNLRLSVQDLAYTINHAEDKLIIVDEVLLPLWEQISPIANIDQVIVIGMASEQYLSYENLIEAADVNSFVAFKGDENAAAFMCYTSGTTGKPKGVLYSHRSIVLHGLSTLMTGVGIGFKETDVLLHIVPMFHAGAWGFPYSSAFAGSKQVFPGPYLDADSLCDVITKERVTITGAVPTVAMNLLKAFDEKHISRLTLKKIIVGGSAIPKNAIESFDKKYNIEILHTWGMTELSPLGSTAVLPKQLQSAAKELQYDYASKQGRPVPFVEIRAKNENGLVAWNGETLGELEVRGPWVVSNYYGETTNALTEDGWFKTGDLVCIHSNGCIEIKDRIKDVIKSGGEWISSLAIENYLMAHDSILEAAVIAIPDDKWMERPFVYFVSKPNHAPTDQELKDYLSLRFAKFWIPEGYEQIDMLPKTSVGKIQKAALRQKYQLSKM
jgi:fatty-acyl-CoA synthase